MSNKAFTRLTTQADRLTKSIKHKASSIPNNFGLCSKCDYFEYTSTKLGSEVYFCGRNHSFPIRLEGAFDPIVSCTEYYEKGSVTLEFLWNIATFIDVKRNPIGFDLKEDVKVESYKLKDEELVNDYD